MNEEQTRQARRFMQGELRSAAIFHTLSKIEREPRRAATFRRIADGDLRHAARWAALLGLAADRTRPSRLGPASLLLHFLTRIFGTSRVARFLARGEDRNVRRYWQITEAQDMAREEVEHSQALRSLDGQPTAEQPLPHPEGGLLSGEGGTLRAAVLGVNDGLVSNFSLVMGVAGGVTNPDIVVLAGVAGLVAGAFSMAAGEYVSMRSQRDVFENLIEQERTELALWPEEERQELAEIYESKGLTAEEAQRVAARIMIKPDVALDTHVREELGLDPDDLGSPWGAAFSSLTAFTVGALVPIAPYLLGAGDLAFSLSAVFSAGALVVVGAGLAWFSGVNPLWGGARMLLMGGMAAAVTFAIGSLIGIAV